MSLCNTKYKHNTVKQESNNPKTRITLPEEYSEKNIAIDNANTDATNFPRLERFMYGNLTCIFFTMFENNFISFFSFYSSLLALFEPLPFPLPHQVSPVLF